MPSKGLEITKIGTDLSITKETIKAGVFKPWWELPSMSMADYAEQEIRHMKEEEEARKYERMEFLDPSRNDPGPAKKYKQLEEEGLEDDLDLVDKATERYVLRDWKAMDIGRESGMIGEMTMPRVLAVQREYNDFFYCCVLFSNQTNK